MQLYVSRPSWRPTPRPTPTPTLRPTTPRPTPKPVSCTLAKIDESCSTGDDCCSGLCLITSTSKDRVCISTTPAQWISPQYDTMDPNHNNNNLRPTGNYYADYTNEMCITETEDKIFTYAVPQNMYQSLEECCKYEFWRHTDDQCMTKSLQTAPTSQPSNQPSSEPSSQPSSQPTSQPSSQPSSKKTDSLLDDIIEGAYDIIEGASTIINNLFTKEVVSEATTNPTYEGNDNEMEGENPLFVGGSLRGRW